MVSAFIAGLGVWEILVVLVVALIVFGPRLPEVAKSLGKGYMEFRKGLRTFESEIDFGDADVDVYDPPRRPEPPASDDREEPGAEPIAHGEPAQEHKEEEETP
ncbi:MAG: Sec-independent protein translocase subunit TatA/TatB [Planctomycetota bacterium]